MFDCEQPGYRLSGEVSRQLWKLGEVPERGRGWREPRACGASPKNVDKRLREVRGRRRIQKGKRQMLALRAVAEREPVRSASVE